MARRSHFKLRLPLLLHAYADLIQQRRAAAKYAVSKANDAEDNSDTERESRVYRRLKETSLSDRIFYTLRQRRRDRLIASTNPPSQLHQRLQAKHRHRLYQSGMAATALSASIAATVWTALFVTERVTLGGVPYRIITTFWNDKTARDAYFSGDTLALHNQLSTLGVEENIKAYYRPQFDNEHELDKYIHQIMFDRTGYVGEAYQVNHQGQLY